MDQQFQTLYFPLLDDPSPPGVRNLQRWLEDAWKQGSTSTSTHHLALTRWQATMISVRVISNIN